MTGVRTDLSRGVRRRLLTCLIVMALALPGPARADAASDMFGFMFRMMLTMMNVMSSTVNNNSGGWPGSVNPFGSGATTWPLMSSMYGMSGWPGSGFGSSPWNTPWTGLQNPYSRGWYNPRGRPPFPYNTGAVLLKKVPGMERRRDSPHPGPAFLLAQWSDCAERGNQTAA